MNIDVKRGPRGGIVRPIELVWIIEDGETVDLQRITTRLPTTTIMMGNAKVTLSEDKKEVIETNE